jgi:hypothetical protein
MPGAPPMPFMPRTSVAKATTVYVGKIATTVPNEVIRRLLEACGKVRRARPGAGAAAKRRACGVGADSAAAN